MLRYLRIRTKLLIALGLLCAIVLTLSVGGFLSIYAYRQLASSVSDRAAELPLTSSLTRDVEQLRNTYHHIHDHSSSENPLARISLTNEREQFRTCVADVRSSANAYRSELDAGDDVSSLLSDRSRERHTIDAMLRGLERIDEIVRAENWALKEIDYARLEIELDSLADSAQQLPTFLQQHMLSLREDVRVFYRMVIGWMWGCSILAFGMFAALIFLFHRVVVKPFGMLLKGSRTISEGAFDHRIELGTGDELAELAQSMNDMTSRFLSTESELKNVIAGKEEEICKRTNEAIRNEQLASVGFLAAGVAHEINNPLASIAWSAEALESRLHDQLYDTDSTEPLNDDQLSTLRTNLRRIQDEAFRCKGITEHLLDFSRLGNVKREPTDLKHLVEDVVAMVGTLGQYRCKTIRLDCPEEVNAAINGQEIKQVVLNLLTNALESVDTDGAIDVRLRQRGDVAVMTVEDDGCGMDDHVQTHLFEPFFTSGKEGQGTGLGLSISYRIVQQHGGRMTAQSEGPGRGARLEVTLPLKQTVETDVQKNAA
ncbi:C4-dicarboxylate transport sensor protein DctB [Rosistilla carotiformis]|uniref:histidine kinase n=1 Tax=Rosistilla carotiformis TaxID=2528017 RepID=A0A518JWX7_9BACT|nr:HAMP domain-containing sensor histidine kinase [Rosistilla carotiformis]QDV70057.1 C4-dicarboxylate transport sensor protein DctB [Rosistilla carotiformis]